MRRNVMFTVVGRGDFPTDMLRYDRAYPANTEDALRIAPSRYADPSNWDTRKVELISQNLPTIGRWESFGWQVIPDSVRKY